MALAAVWGEKKLSEIAEQFDAHPDQISAWREQLLNGASDVFSDGEESASPTPTVDAKIGELTLENDAQQGLRGLRPRSCYDIRRARQGWSVAERKAMIDKSHDLQAARQAEMLWISRGSVYYLQRPAPPADLALRRRIDELHLEHPLAGSRMLQGLLQQKGFEVGRLHVKTLMRKMRIEAIYRRPNTSRPEPGHKIFPYLLRKVPVAAHNHV